MEQPPDPMYPVQPPLGPPLPPVPPGAIRPSPMWDEPPPPAPPPANRTGWVVAGVVVVIALIAGLLLLRDGGEDDVAGPAEESTTTSTEADESTTTTAGEATTTTAAGPPTEQEFDAVVDEIVQFVETERGLEFLREPDVALAAADEFEAALLEGFEEDADALATSGRVLEAIGLLEPGTDVVETFRTLLGAGVVGFYDPETQELLVRGTSVSPYVRTVIAHELTHALDDQHFDLDRPELEESHDEQGAGFTALVEGNAVHVESAYRATFTSEEEDEASAEELELGSDPRIFDVPIPLIEAIQTPYELGPELIDAIIDAGGQQALDTSFLGPPTTSEQMLEPDTYIGGEGAVTVTAPSPDAAEIDHGVLGAMGVAQMLGLGPLLNPGALDDAVVGWGGDQYVAWLGPDGLACLRDTIVGDTPQDTDELLDAITEWTTNPPLFSSPVDATVTGGVDGAPITFTTCAQA